MSDTPFSDTLRVVATETKLSGGADRLDRDLTFGERLVLVVDVSVASLRLKASGDGPVAVRDLKALDVYELDGTRGADVLATLRAERRNMDDTAAGKAPLPGLEGPELIDPDGRGALATPAELDADEGIDLTEPWPGYDGQGVAEVLDAVESTIEAAGPASAGAIKLLERVEAYERSQKARSGVLNGVEAMKPQDPPPAGDTPPLPGEDDEDGLELDDEDGGADDDGEATPDVFDTP